MKNNVTSNRMLYVKGEDWFTEIVVIKSQINGRSLRELRNAVDAIDNYLHSEVLIDRPNSPYDCTGQPFTSSINLLNKDITNSVNGRVVIYIYRHHVCYDV